MFCHGAPYWIRTNDPQLRRLLLYPTELTERKAMCGRMIAGQSQVDKYLMPGARMMAIRARLSGGRGCFVLIEGFDDGFLYGEEFGAELGRAVEVAVQVNEAVDDVAE